MGVFKQAVTVLAHYMSTSVFIKGLAKGKENVFLP